MDVCTTFLLLMFWRGGFMLFIVTIYLFGTQAIQESSWYNSSMQVSIRGIISWSNHNFDCMFWLHCSIYSIWIVPSLCILLFNANISRSFSSSIFAFFFVLSLFLLTLFKYCLFVLIAIAAELSVAAFICLNGSWQKVNNSQHMYTTFILWYEFYELIDHFNLDWKTQNH